MIVPVPGLIIKNKGGVCHALI